MNGWEQYPLEWTVLLAGWERLCHAVGWNEQDAVSVMGWGSQCPHGAFLSFANFCWTLGVHVTHQLPDTCAPCYCPLLTNIMASSGQMCSAEHAGSTVPIRPCAVMGMIVCELPPYGHD